VQFRLHQRQLRKTCRSKWKDGLSFDTRLAPGLWPVHGAGTIEFESEGHPSGAKRRKKFFFLVVPLHFFGLKVQLVVLVSAFVMVSTVWPVSCLLFFCSQCPHTLRSRHHCCSYALRGSYKSIIVTHAIDTAVRLWAPTHINLLLQPRTPRIFLKLIGFAPNSRLFLSPAGGSWPHLPPPRDEANEQT